MPQRTPLLAICLALICLPSTMTSAKKNDPNIELAYVPQQTVGRVNVDLERFQRVVPVALRVVDGRRGDDDADIGTRTDDANLKHPLYATTDVVAFVETTARGLLREWGVALDDQAALRLELEVITYKATETNQAVGATYAADVRLGWRLSEGERELRAGQVSSSASRYGRKFSRANVNEVLSDAFLATLSELLAARSLKGAWEAGTAPVADSPATAPPPPRTFEPTPPPPTLDPAAPSRDVVTPAQLLADLRSFLDGDFAPATIVDYLARKTLSRPLSADELVDLKNSGVSEEVVRAVVNLPSMAP